MEALVQRKYLLSFSDRHIYEYLVEHTNRATDSLRGSLNCLGVSKADSLNGRVVGEGFIVVDQKVEFAHPAWLSRILCDLSLDALAKRIDHPGRRICPASHRKR